ncbi:MAG: hypothetical protein GXY35_02095 [Chlamydiae bacterium]|nr:hypothetical protein [Chlamydiota bacterium]HQM51744.1 hypothetical protein [bacterium]
MMNAATVSIAAALLFAWAASAAAQDRPAPAGSVVKFKNGSIMPCRIVREDERAVLVESYGVEFEIVRDEIEYHGDAAGCPGLSREELAGFGPAVNIAAPRRTAPPEAAADTPTPSHPRPAASPAAPSGAVTLRALEADPARFRGQRIVFHRVKLGEIRPVMGVYAIELLPPGTLKGERHVGGSSADLAARRVTFILPEARAKELREHSNKYDPVRVEFTVEQRLIGGVPYWVAPVGRLDVFRGEGDEIAWTVW